MREYESFAEICFSHDMPQPKRKGGAVLVASLNSTNVMPVIDFQKTGEFHRIFSNATSCCSSSNYEQTIQDKKSMTMTRLKIFKNSAGRNKVDLRCCDRFFAEKRNNGQGAKANRNRKQKSIAL